MATIWEKAKKTYCRPFYMCAYTYLFERLGCDDVVDVVVLFFCVLFIKLGQFYFRNYALRKTRVKGCELLIFYYLGDKKKERKRKRKISNHNIKLNPFKTLTCLMVHRGWRWCWWVFNWKNFIDTKRHIKNISMKNINKTKN